VNQSWKRGIGTNSLILNHIDFAAMSIKTPTHIMHSILTKAGQRIRSVTISTRAMVKGKYTMDTLLATLKRTSPSLLTRIILIGHIGYPTTLLSKFPSSTIKFITTCSCLWTTQWAMLKADKQDFSVMVLHMMVIVHRVHQQK
jgi:hypothetical protein